MIQPVLLLILGKIFVCSDFQCDLDLPQGICASERFRHRTPVRDGLTLSP